MGRLRSRGLPYRCNLDLMVCHIVGDFGLHLPRSAWLASATCCIIPARASKPRCIVRPILGVRAFGSRGVETKGLKQKRVTLRQIGLGIGFAPIALGEARQRVRLNRVRPF